MIPFEICQHCQEPIVAGDAWHTVARMHWACYEVAYPQPEKALETYRETIAKADAALAEINSMLGVRKRPCRPGDGPIARRLARRLSALVERQLGWKIPAEDFWFWVQPPEYRGPRWDLAVWGCHVKAKELPGGMLMLNSWDTMTALLRCKHLTLSHEGGMEWGVGEGRGPDEAPIRHHDPRGYKHV